GLPFTPAGLAHPVMDTPDVDPHRPRSPIVGKANQWCHHQIRDADLFSQLTFQTVEHGFARLVLATREFPATRTRHIRAPLGNQKSLVAINQYTDRNIQYIIHQLRYSALIRTYS